MSSRAARRDRTARHCERQQRLRPRAEFTAGSAHRFAKRHALGCNCIRRFPGYSPKVAAGYCHGAGHDYHPSTIKRIAGKRLARAWRAAVRAAHPDDVDL